MLIAQRERRSERSELEWQIDRQIQRCHLIAGTGGSERASNRGEIRFDSCFKSPRPRGRCTRRNLEKELGRSRRLKRLVHGCPERLGPRRSEHNGELRGQLLAIEI